MTVRELKPLVLDPDLDPWERQPTETVLRFNQFAGYRDLGRTRTLRKVADTLTLSAAYLRSVSAAMLWVERAAAFDRHRDELHQQAWLEQRRKAADNDARLLDTAVGKVARRLQALDPNELGPAELIRMLDVAIRHRRALFGDPEVTVAVTGPGGDPLTVQLAEFADMPLEQRRQAIIDLTDAVRRRAGAAQSLDDDDADGESG